MRGRKDGAIENIRLRKVCTIMTANPQPILDFIIKEMNRSATVEKAYGAYTHHELSVLVTVLTRRQALQLRNFLRENDPHSFITIVNLVLVVLGFVFLGVKCMGWTIYSSFALSFFVSVCEWLYPSGVSMSGDAMLDLVFAVFLPALGAAIVFDIGASTGGTDIVALILAKYTSMEIGKALMASDILIVLAAAWRFGMGTGLYCILGLIGKSFVVDGAIENIRLRKVCTIMTANPQPILDFIIKEMNRSATVEKAYGAYTHHELSVLVTVLTRRQALQLRNFLRENDPHSFITIVNSSEIIGKGFRSFN